MPDRSQESADSQLIEALARFLDGEPEPDDNVVIAAALVERPELADELANLLTIDELLRQRATGSDAFVDSVAICLAHPDDAEEFVRSVRQKIMTTAETISIGNERRYRNGD